MSVERSEQRSPEVEKGKILDLNIISLNSCKSIDEMIDVVEKASREGKLDTVILGEYTFKVDEVLNDLKKIQGLAKNKGVDIILAPSNPYNDELGHGTNWETLRKQLQEQDVTTEQIDLEDGPETIGIFVGANGFTYAFPKAWKKNPVHKIPNTNIGVTICGEIGHIQPEDLEGINILYNPSREADDPYLKFRMLNKYGNQPLTREAVSDILLEDEYYKNLLDDSRYDPDDPEYIPKSDSREARERQFNEAVERNMQKAVDTKSSTYVEKIDKALQQRGIPVVRCDGPKCTGVLNPLPDIKVEGLEYKNAYTRYRLTKEK